jgi:hypothetical protein
MRRFFFGRQSETLDALRRLGCGLDGVYRRWLQVEGPSGVGKSSLVKAGLIPAIKRGWLEEGRHLVICSVCSRHVWVVDTAL